MSALDRLREMLRERLSADDFAKATALLVEAVHQPSRVERVVIDPSERRRRMQLVNQA